MRTWGLTPPTAPMRPFALLVALLLAAPLFSGCADGFVADMPTASSVEATAALDCARFSGLQTVDPGTQNAYSFDFSDCGTEISNTLSLSGDASVVAADCAASPCSYLLVQAGNVPNGSYTLTATFTYQNGGTQTTRQLSYPVSITGPPPPPTYDLVLTVTPQSNSVLATWDPAEVDPQANLCRMQVRHYLRDGTPIDNRYETVSCTSGTFTDQGHRSTTTRFDFVEYTLRTLKVIGGVSRPQQLQEAARTVYAVEAEIE